MWITWKHQDSDFSHQLSFEDKVEIFYQRALGWQLHIADLLANGGQPFGEQRQVPPIRHSGFAVLQICLSYFETIGHYEQKAEPKLKDACYFKLGVRSVLPDLLASYEDALDDLLAVLYKGARCGLYHNSMTVRGVGLGRPDNDEPMAYDPQNRILVISPERLPKALKRHLEKFRDQLLNPMNSLLRENFERRFNADNLGA